MSYNHSERELQNVGQSMADNWHSMLYLASKMTRKLAATGNTDLSDPDKASLPATVTRGRGTTRETRGM